MMYENPCDRTTFGYLSTLESAEHGFFGGYLLISLQGRPREFHCTAPVRPSRAQRILYGPTLPAYLLGEQIGGTLLANSKLKPQLVIINQLDALSLRLQADFPVVLLIPSASVANDAIACRDAVWDSGDDVEARCPQGPRSSPAPPAAHDESGSRFYLNEHQFALPAGFESDYAAVAPALQALAAHVDLAEPFGRIHEAIREAQRIDDQEREADGQAA